MLLSELKWRKYENEYWEQAPIPGTRFFVYRRRRTHPLASKTLTITLGWGEEPEPAWRELDDLAAQAILFELTKQVTENDNENVSDHASC